MAIRKIAQMGEPVLRRRADPVPADEIPSEALEGLIRDLVETMRDADGAGLAAPQIYEPVRVCVIEIAENPRYPEAPSMPLTVFVNPVVEPLVGDAGVLADRDAIVMYEGCLSVHGLRGAVRRPRKVRVRALDSQGQPFELVLEGLLAAVIQHETDHLDGALFVDRADPATLAFLREFQRYVPPDERFVDGGVE